MASERDVASELGLDPKNDQPMINKCVMMCGANGLSAVELNARWMKYAMENNNCDISVVELDKLDKILRAAPRKTTQPQKSGVVYTKDNINRAVPQKTTYGTQFGGTPDKNGNKAAKTEPSSSPSFVAGSPRQSQGSPQPHGSPMQTGSPVQQPAVALTPAANRYHVRDEAKRGKIELTFNEQLPSAFVDVAAAKNHVPMRVEVSCIEQQERLARLARYQQQTAAEGAEGGFSKIEAPPPTHVFSENFRFMHQDLSSAASDMNNRIQHLAHEIAAENGLDATEFTGVSVPSQTGVLTYGRIISDSMDGRLNAASVMLEGDDSLSHGYRVRLDLTEVESFALFPGQVCVIEGHNVTGQVLVVQKIYTNARLPAASSTTAEMQQQRPLTIMYAAGPFHLCPPAPAAPTSIAEAAQPSTLDIVPLVDLIVHAKRCTPDVLILSGPFIDAEADIVARVGTTENFCLRSDRDEELLSDILSYVQSQLSGTKTNVVLVPSTRDLPLDPVFPQPPLPTGLVPNLDFTLAPNPCTLRVNNCVIGVCAEDVMFDLSKNLCTKNIKDRLTPAYLFEQQSFYPKYPSEDNVPFDFTFSAGLNMNDDHRPDILFSPSRLGRFVKTYDEHSLGINPERLVKSEAAGTFAFLTIQPLNMEKLDSNDSSVAFKDPQTDELLYFHRLAGRTRVDIVRI